MERKKLRYALGGTYIGVAPILETTVVMSAPQIYMLLEMHFVIDDFHGCNPL